MARLRQTYANRYASAEATSAEFESIIRYLNSAELGNNTLKELLLKVFDQDGELNLGLDFRFEPGVGLQYRVDAVNDVWETIATEDEVRGAPGLNVGSVEAPLFSNMEYFTGNGVQTSFPYYTGEGAADVLLWVGGVLQRSSAYSFTVPGTSVVLLTPPANGASVCFATVRQSPSVTYQRIDHTSVAGQVVFPFPHSEDDELIVFVNGIFKREGGGYDYVRSSASGTINMTTPQALNAVVTIMNVANSNIRAVSGLMLEERYATNGMLRFDRISIADNAIAQAKVSGLVAALALRADIYVQGSTPSTPRPGSLWVNTAGVLPSLNFFDGTRWVSANAEGLIPAPTNADALSFLRLNASATGFEYADFDTSSFVLKNTVGTAAGVAPLDNAGLIPATAIPAYLARRQLNARINGALSATTYKAALISNTTATVQGFSVELGSGAATVQLAIGGVNVGTPIAASTTPQRLAISNHLVNSLTTPQSVQLVVSSPSSANDLVVTLDMLVTG